MRESVTEEQRRAYIRAVSRRVAEHGWIVQGVLPRADAVEEVSGPPKFYTVGLTVCGLPELVLTDFVSPSAAAAALNQLASRSIRDELPVGVWVELDGFSQPVRARAGEVSGDPGVELVIAMSMYGARVRVRVVELEVPSIGEAPPKKSPPKG